VSKNKLKFVIFIISLFAFFSIDEVVIKASDYNIDIISVEGLQYGDSLNRGKIIARAIDENENDVPGYFSFHNGNSIIDSIGEQTYEVVFTPDDLNNYSSKKVSVTTNVSKRRIFIIFASPLYKQYDGTTNISLPQYSLSGILNEEVSVAGSLNAVLEAGYVGEGIGVILSGLSIEGDKSEYYYIDFLGHSARISPSTLEKSGENATIITLEKDVYVDVVYSLKVVMENVNEIVKDKYTSFLKYSYKVYNHNNQYLAVDGKFKVSMDIEEEILNKERLQVYELTSDGEYKELSYVYKNNKIVFEIDNDSSLVFTTRNIEYELIILFIGILIFSGIILLLYRYKNNRTKDYIKY